MNHSILKRLQEIFLELEMGQFCFLQKTHRKLAQCVQRKEPYVRVVMAANLYQNFR